jgi:L-alanine-DL-glutamate epimerase-like enolase superfamily enzyme
MSAAQVVTGAVVESVDVAAYTIPTDAPESDGTIAWDRTTIIVVEPVAGGVRGLGYSYADANAARLVAETLAPAVQGLDAMDVGRAWSAMVGTVRNLGRPGLAATAISAVDNALWDLKARLLGLPLADALPRFHDAAPIYGSGGFTSYSPQRLREQLGGWAAQGIPRVKMKVGREPEKDPERIGVARAAIGDGVELFVDANGAYTRKQALYWAEAFAREGISYLEEPVSSEDREGLRLLRDRGPGGLPVAAGEYEWTLPQLADLAGCVDILQADVTRCGGITNLLRLDGICKGRQIPFSAHCAPAISAHACCAMESLLHLEYFHDHVRLEDMLFDGVLNPEGGYLRPEESRPGLGLELKRSEAERYAA